MSDEVDFFDAGKHQRFLEVDFKTLGIKVFYKATGLERHGDGHDQAFWKYLK